jgi:hypothetical protein
MNESERSHLEQAMLDDKLAATDWEATQDELMQQVTRESYLQWIRETNQQHNDNKTVGSSSSTSPSATTSEHATPTNQSKSCRLTIAEGVIVLVDLPRNLLPLKLDERKDCEFALPFHYEGDARSSAGKQPYVKSNDRTMGIVVDLGDDDDDDDDALMRQVLAISQIEYVESLKKQRQPPNSDDPHGPSSSSDTHLL